jgi:hypothetical protein
VVPVPLLVDGLLATGAVTDTSPALIVLFVPDGPVTVSETENVPDVE